MNILKFLFSENYRLNLRRKQDPNGYYPKLITPTLGRRVIVEEDEYFKQKLTQSRQQLNQILNKYKK